MDLQDINKVYRAYKTLLQMLKDRHYVITDQKLNTSLADFKLKIKEGGEIRWENLNDLYNHEKGP